MAGIPVKLTFDLSYTDHARALGILRAQKHTTQFVVNLILSAAGFTAQSPYSEQTTGNRQVAQATERLPQNATSDPQSSPQATQVTQELPAITKTSLEDIPSALLGFIEGE